MSSNCSIPRQIIQEVFGENGGIGKLFGNAYLMESQNASIDEQINAINEEIEKRLVDNGFKKPDGPVITVDSNGNVSYDEAYLLLADGLAVVDDHAHPTSSRDSIRSMQLYATDNTIINRYRKRARELNDERFAIEYKLRNDSDRMSQDDVVYANRRIIKINQDLVMISNFLESYGDVAKDKVRIPFLRIEKCAAGDLGMVEEYLNGVEYMDHNYIEGILAFWEKAANIEGNPLFNTEQLMKDGKLTDEADAIIDEVLAPIVKKVGVLRAKLEARKSDLAWSIALQNENFKKIYERERKADGWEPNLLTFYKDGLPDTSIFSKYLVDMTAGVLHHNGFIPQLMQMKMDATFSAYNVNVNKLKQDLNRTVKPAEKALKELDEKDRMINGVDVGWGVFLDYADNGLRRDGIIRPYSSKYNDTRAKVFMAYNKALAEGGDKLVAAAFNRNKWLYEHNDAIDPEVLVKLAFENNISIEIESIRDSLIELMGHLGYEELIDSFVKSWNGYHNSYNAMVANALQLHKVNHISKLPDTVQGELEAYREANDPVIIYNKFNSGKLNMESVASLTIIPKSHIMRDGMYVTTGYYNERFKVIDRNPALANFYRVLYKNQQLIHNMLPPNMRVQMGQFSLLGLKKSFNEILAEKNMPAILKFFAKVAHWMKEIWGSFFKRPHTYRKKKVDPITGKIIDKIDTGWFESNKMEILDLVNEYHNKIKISLGMNLSIPLSNKEGYDLRHPRMQPTVAMLAELLGVPPTYEAVASRLQLDSSIVRLPQVIRECVTDHVMQQQSMDLPRMLRMQVHLASVYAARTEALPALNLLKEHYDKVKDRQGKTRENAMTQMNSWFRRIVYDDHSPIQDLDSGTNKIIFKSVHDKKREAELNEMIAHLSAHMTNEGSFEDKEMERQYNKYVEEKEHLGKYFSFKAFIENMLEFIRWKALSWNLNSNVTNFFEGQRANMIEAARGIYFNEAQLYRSNHIVFGNLMRTYTFGAVKTPGARKAKLLMAKFDVQQDATNELYRASQETTYDRRKKLLAPFEITNRTEFLNQSPMMIAIMLNTEIEGKNGVKSNLWDALNNDGRLKDEFRTEHNIQTWEENNTTEFFNFKSKVSKIIINTHGDYHDTHGNLSSEYILGKASMMFKRWVVRGLHNRFASEHYDIEIGDQKIKGRYRSFTLGQSILTMGIVGLTFSPLMALIGATAGISVGLMFGQRTDVSILSDLGQNIVALGSKIIGMPIGVLIGKPIGYNLNRNITPDELDYQNMRGNIAEATMILHSFILATTFKAAILGAFGEDDDDEGESYLLNALTNRAQTLLNSGVQFLNPLAMANDIFLDAAVVRWGTDLFKFAAEVNEGLFDGGFEKSYKKFEKAFMPSPLRPWWGFQSQFEKVHGKWGFDPLLEEVFKSENDKMKDEMDKEIQEVKADDELDDSEKKQAIRSIRKEYRDNGYIPRGKKKSRSEDDEAEVEPDNDEEED